MPRDSRTRFSDRVEAYLRYRPAYPTELFDELERRCALAASAVIADIGSGTGILTRPWLERGYQVYAVEPNRPMREAAEGLLGSHDRLVSRAGSAEATTLETDSVDLACAAQAFHWFDRVRTRQELVRILRPAGWMAIVWNDRRKTSTPFLEAYETLLLEHGTDYDQVDHSRIGASELEAFFGPGGYREARFDNHQTLDFDGLKGRVESTSYTPAIGTPGHASMIEDLGALFDRYNAYGTVSIDYDTVLYLGRLT